MNTATAKKPREQFSPADCQSSSIWRLQPAQAAAGIRQLPTAAALHPPALGHRTLQAQCSSNRHLRPYRTLRKASENVKTTVVGKDDRQQPQACYSSTALGLQSPSTHRRGSAVKERCQNWGPERGTVRADLTEFRNSWNEISCTYWNKPLCSFGRRKTQSSLLGASASTVTMLKYLLHSQCLRLSSFLLAMAKRISTAQNKPTAAGEFPSEGSDEPACPYPLLAKWWKETTSTLTFRICTLISENSCCSVWGSPSWSVFFPTRRSFRKSSFKAGRKDALQAKTS